MPFVYGTEQQIQQTILNIQIKAIDYKINPTTKFWIQFGIGIGTTLLHFVPFIGSLAKMAMDVTINIILDTIFAIVEKQEKEEILTNFALNLLPVGSKIFSHINKLRKTKALFTARKLRINNFENGVNQLLKNEKFNFKQPLYKQIEKNYWNPKKLKIGTSKFDLEIIKYEASKIKKRTELFNKLNKSVNKSISTTTNSLRFITDSRYAFQKTSQYLFKKTGIKESLDALIEKTTNYFWNQIHKIFPKKFKKHAQRNLLELRKNWKKTKTILLPLNHTKSAIEGGWIKGVRIQESSIVNYFNIEWHFNPKYKKPKITSYNKPYSFVKGLLESKSSGQFYLNNVAFGWKLKNVWGSHKWDNPFFNGNWNALTYFPIFNNLLSTSARLYRTAKISSIHKFNLDHLKNEWNLQNLQKWLTGIQGGVVLGIKIPGKNLIKKTYATITSRNVKYLSNFATKTTIRKTIKKTQKWNLNKKSGKMKW